LGTLANSILPYGSQNQLSANDLELETHRQTSQVGERTLLHRFLKSNDGGLLSINAMVTRKPQITLHVSAASVLIVAISAPTLEALEARERLSNLNDLPTAILCLSFSFSSPRQSPTAIRQRHTVGTHQHASDARIQPVSHLQ
jgi:hypothetical protein